MWPPELIWFMTERLKFNAVPKPEDYREVYHLAICKLLASNAILPPGGFRRLLARELIKLYAWTKLPKGERIRLERKMQAEWFKMLKRETEVFGLIGRPGPMKPGDAEKYIAEKYGLSIDALRKRMNPRDRRKRKS
jgi:hypothetical protein